MPVVNGTAGNDTLFPQDSIANEIRGLEGNDVLFPGFGFDTLDGGLGFDVAFFFTAFNGQSIFNRGVEASLQDGEARAATDQGIRNYRLIDIEGLFGGLGNDTLTGDDQDNELQGLSGNDQIFGLAGNDTIFTGTGEDFVDAGAGNDDVYPDLGDTTLNGGEGIDWLLFTVVRDGQSIFANGINGDLGAGTATASVGGQTYQYSFENFENLQGSFFDDVLTGSEANDGLSGFEGDDLLSGLAGDDDLYPGIGNDTLDGGAGTDRAIYDFGAFDSGLEINLTTGRTTGTVNGQGFSQQLLSIEEVAGSIFDDLIVGDAGDNRLFGAEGSDTLKGGAGDDFYLGNGGLDYGLYDGASSHFTIRLDLETDTLSIIDRTGAEGTDSGGPNILRFSDRDWTLVGDGELFLDEVDLAADEFRELVELYIAYFNRAPDAEGLHFWAKALVNGTGLDQAADFFFDQPETRALYGTQADTTAFVTAVYNNVLGRGPDAAGENFWVGAIDRGGVTQGQFIRSFLAGARAEPPANADPDFIAQQTADRAFLDDKTDIGLYFGALLGMSDVTNANDVMSLFDGSAASLTAAQQAADAAYQDAVASDGSGEMLIQVIGLVDNPFGTEIV